MKRRNLALGWREAGWVRRSLLRDPQNAFFTIGLPLLYLFIFATLFGSETTRFSGQPGVMTVSTIMTASVVVIGVVSAAFQYPAINLITQRENGVLKRLRSTPVPTGVFVAGQVVNAVAMSVLLAAGVTVLGVVAYDVPWPGMRMVAMAVTVLLGALAGAAAAFPFTRLVGKASAAAAAAVSVTLVLFFISGNFFPGAELPPAMRAVASVFPVRPFLLAVLTAFNPDTTGSGFDGGHLAVLAAWAVGGTLGGLRWFRWVPAGQD